MKASGQRPEGYRIVGVGSDAGPHFVWAEAPGVKLPIKYSKL